MIKLKLLEAVSKEYYEKNYGISGEVFDRILSIDPTPDKKYGRFLMEKFLALNERENRNFLKGTWIDSITSDTSTYYINSSEIRNCLDLYSSSETQKYLPPEKKDILKFKSYKEFVHFCRVDLEKLKEQMKSKIAYKESNIIYEDASIVFLSPKTHKSACYFGSETNWCTSREESSNYYNQYTNTGTIYILKKKGNDGELLLDESIQLFIPKDDAKVLAECREENDKTIYANKLFSLLPSNNKVVQYLMKKWESIPNTDQWEEGTEYLDPKILSPDDEDEDDFDEDEIEEVEVTRMVSRYKVNNDLRIYSSVSIFNFIEIRDSDGDVLEETNSETTFFETPIGKLLTGEDFFKTPDGKSFLKKFLEKEPWKNAKNNNFESLPSFFERTLVVEYEDHSFSEIKDIAETNFSYDETDNDFDVWQGKIVSKSMGGVHAVIILASDEALMGEEPMYQKVMYNFDNPVVEKLTELRNESSMYTTSKNFFEMEFDTEESSRMATVVYFSDIGIVSPLLIDHPLIKRLMSEKFIRNDKKKAKHEQQFLNYEKAGIKKEKSLMKEKS